MNSFGDNLRHEREAKGITLEEVAAQTKIGIRQLKAIEDEQLDLLPGGIFTKSFLRQYARFLRVDEEYIIAEYQKAAGIHPEPEILVAPPVNTVSSGDFRRESERFSFSMIPSLEDSTPKLAPRIIMALTFVGVLGGGIFFGVRAWKKRSVKSLEQAAAQTALVIPAKQISAPVSSTESGNSTDTTAVPAPTTTGPTETSGNPAEGIGAATGGPTTGVVADPQPPKNAAAPLQDVPPPDSAAKTPASKSGVDLVVAATHESWVSILADGQKQFQGNLKAGESKRVNAKDSVKLTLGDAGAVTLTMNGQQLPAAGRSGEAKTITVSSKNVTLQTP